MTLNWLKIILVHQPLKPCNIFLSHLSSAYTLVTVSFSRICTFDVWVTWTLSCSAHCAMPLWARFIPASKWLTRRHCSYTIWKKWSWTEIQNSPLSCYCWLGIAPVCAWIALCGTVELVRFWSRGFRWCRICFKSRLAGFWFMWFAGLWWGIIQRQCLRSV